MNPPLIVSALWVYPIKSTQGIRLRSAVVGERGIEHDRRWMLVNAQGDQITQREHPALSLVQVAIEADGLRVHREGHGSCFVPFVAQGGPMTAKLWKVPYEALRASPEADAWFSDYLREPVRLAYMPETTERRMNPLFGTARVGFADGNPLHLITEASLADLSSRRGEEVSPERFRANVVIRGGQPFDEDSWATIQLGDTELDLVEPTFRCAVVNVDAPRGTMTSQPLRTLAQYRKQGSQIEFGHNLVVNRGGTFHVDDELRILKHRLPTFPRQQA